MSNKVKINTYKCSNCKSIKFDLAPLDNANQDALKGKELELQHVKGITKHKHLSTHWTCPICKTNNYLIKPQ